MVRVWQSYSCNNSAAYRLIARFSDPARARETTAELHDYFEAQARLGNHRYDAGPLATLARTYGFDWTDGSMGRGPAVVCEGDLVIVFHPQCLGLGPGVAAFLEDRGGVPGKETSGTLHISVLFRAPPGVDAQLDAELDTLFAQPTESKRGVVAWKAPWSKTPASGEVMWFRDAGTVGIYGPITPPDLPALKSWLADRGIDRPVLAIEDHADRDLFAALRTARCTSCGGLLEYLDPRLHDIEAPQLVCTPCGGLYDLKAFVP